VCRYSGDLLEKLLLKVIAAWNGGLPWTACQGERRVVQLSQDRIAAGNRRRPRMGAQPEIAREVTCRRQLRCALGPIRTRSIVRCADYQIEGVRAALTQALAPLGGMAAFVKPGERIGSSPNVLLGSDPAQAIITHPAVLAAVALASRTRELFRRG